jgi:hypothetical protein
MLTLLLTRHSTCMRGQPQVELGCEMVDHCICVLAVRWWVSCWYMQGKGGQTEHWCRLLWMLLLTRHFRNMHPQPDARHSTPCAPMLCQQGNPPATLLHPHLPLSLRLMPPLFPNASLNEPAAPGGPSLSFCTAESSSGVDAPVLPAAAGLAPSASSCS